jgi:hypothetical protein
MSRQELADEANRYLFDATSRHAALTANYVGKLERGVFRWPDRDYREAFRTILCASSDAELGFFITRRGCDDLSSDTAADTTFRPARLAAVRLIGTPIVARGTAPFTPNRGDAGQLRPPASVPPDASLSGLWGTAVDVGQLVLDAPAGHFLGGASIDLQVYPATDDGRILAEIPPGYSRDQFLLRPRRALVAGVIDDGMATAYALDSRHARQRLSGAGGQTRLLVPKAYVLDEITLGLLWAVANLDEALLSDDRSLASAQQQFVPYELLSRSAVSHELVSELTTASAMWLGSQFCARHIVRNLDQVEHVPVFWTREQHGEEASTWLLFTHKYDYLQDLAARFNSGMARAFCIPSQVAEASPPAESVLLMLAASLMESFGIQVQIVADQEYETIDGFVLDGQGRAIVANWVRADGVWHVDVTTSRPTIRQYADASGYARAHSVIGTDDPAHRLRALCDYLALDWIWLTRRCAELGEQGTAGIAQPRSRLLSLAGVDRACRYLGRLAATSL